MMTALLAFAERAVFRAEHALCRNGAFWKSAACRIEKMDPRGFRRTLCLAKFALSSAGGTHTAQCDLKRADKWMFNEKDAESASFCTKQQEPSIDIRSGF